MPTAFSHTDGVKNPEVKEGVVEWGSIYSIYALGDIITAPMQLCREWPFTDDKGLYGRFHFNLHLSLCSQHRRSTIPAWITTPAKPTCHTSSQSILHLLLCPRVYINIYWSAGTHAAISLARCVGRLLLGRAVAHAVVYTRTNDDVLVFTHRVLYICIAVRKSTRGFMASGTAAEVNWIFASIKYGRMPKRSAARNSNNTKIWSKRQAGAFQFFQWNRKKKEKHKLYYIDAPTYCRGRNGDAAAGQTYPLFLSP